MTASRSTPTVEIRRVADEDREAVLDIARELVRAGETYAFDADMPDEELWRYWSPLERGQGFVAVSEARLVGAFVLRRNQAGPGSHVGNASYVVRADARGLGVGRRMGEASLELATELGFRALQFNCVVSTNRGALRLWESLGFEIVGTIPEGFRLPDGRLVAHHIMHRKLP